MLEVRRKTKLAGAQEDNRRNHGGSFYLFGILSSHLIFVSFLFSSHHSGDED
ncbi:hypothetical protein HanRHA438_Chr16g0756421 [Helianthus annuus]|nr:hypothetical protein HanRHA438_Chr16g0756421 [Helianthus annuus]